MICIARSFGAPVIEPPGKQPRSRSIASRPGAQLAGDGAHEVMHGREALDVEEPRHLHRAQPAVLRKIVAQEIDDHHVLGAVLLARAQRLRELRIEPRDARRAGACP